MPPETNFSLLNNWQLELSLLLRSMAGSLLIVLVVVLGYKALYRALATLQTRGRVPLRIVDTLQRILRGLAVVLAILLILQQFGVLANAWTTISAVLAVIGVGFIAMWSVLSNSFCALILIIMRPFDVGDTIELTGDNVSGKVINFNLLFTTLRDEDGSLVQIPNNLFFQKSFRRRIGESTIGLDEQMEKETPSG